MIAVFSSTLYPDVSDQRFLSCMEFLREANALGIPCYIGDSSTNSEFHQALDRYATRIDTIGQSMAKQKSAALSAAFGAKCQALVHTELEKVDFVRDIQKVCTPILSGDKQLIIPKRSSESWETYPDAMRWSEGFALDAVERVLGHRWDIAFGPFAIHRDLADRFITCQSEKWAWLHAPRLRLLREMPDMAGEVEVDFHYPAVQCAAEEGDPSFLLKRIAQIDFMLRPLVDGA